jgi:hypothetical protein
MRETGTCDHCGSAAGSVFVHGHEQCISCGTVQVPCCEGAESCATAVPASTALSLPALLPPAPQGSPN